MNISIIIPNYNGAHLLEKNIPKLFSVLEKIKNTYEVIIVDDASADTSQEVLTTLSKKYPLKTFFKKENGGFSHTVNTGVGLAMGEFLLLLNTDVIPEEGFISPLLSHFENPKVFAVGCMDKSVEKEGVVLRGRGIGSFSRGFLLHAKGNNEKENTLWVSGGSGMFRKSLWDKLRGLDDLFNPFYWEDIDLSYRAQKAGYICLFEKKSVVLHEHEKGAIKSKYSSDAVKRIAYRNQFLFVWKNVTSPMYLFEHILWLPVHLIRAAISSDIAFLVGFIEAIKRLPQLLTKRAYQSSITKISDEDVLKHFSV